MDRNITMAPMLAPITVTIARETFKDQPNVQVMGFSGLLMNFVQQQGAQLRVDAHVIR